MSRKCKSSKVKLENWEKGVKGGDWSCGNANCFSVSFLRQLSEQYRTELQGTMICFSQVVQYCRKLVAIRSSSSKSSSFLCTAFLLAPVEFERLDKGAGLDGRAWAGRAFLEVEDGWRV